MKMSKIYTRTGDNGTTSLVGGVRVKKSSIRLEAYGTIDELSSQLGLLAAMLSEDNTDRDFIIRIQNNLFNVGTHLATDQSTTKLYPSAKLPEGEIQRLEEEIDAVLPLLPPINGFVLQGGCLAAAQAHVCRTVCRRAERHIACLAEIAAVDSEIQQYVNRLSDYLFILARKINFNNDVNEIIWKNTCK
jgi:cob(I)alamin adenosyltransferase